MNIKYVIVEQINYGRSYRAKAGLAFTTEVDAQNWIINKINEKYRNRYHVESRKVKDVDSSQTMHCQCCSRPIHAALGTIAHHGYQRPGYGWQTASCFGAKRLPWEVDRSAVAELIDYLKDVLLNAEKQCLAVSDEIEPVTVHYTGEYNRTTGRHDSKSIEVTRSTFDRLVQDDPRIVRGRYDHDATFDGCKRRDLASRELKIKQLKMDIKEFTARYAGWTQTHKWNGKLWEAL